MTQGLDVVRPLVVTPAMVIASNVAETDYAEWATGTTYAQGARAILAAQHKVYESVIAENIGNNPATDAEAWIEVGPTNKFKAFDKTISTQTARASSITYQLRPGTVIGAFSALNLTGANTIRVRMIDPVYGTVYDRTVSVRGALTRSSWWEWYFGARIPPKQVILTGLPAFPNADVYIDMQGTAQLAVGVLIVGQVSTFSMGVNNGARIGIQDFSQKGRNAFGDLILKEGAFAKRANLPMLLRASEVDAFYEFLVDVRATACLWIPSNRFRSLTVYGVYKNFDIVFPYYDYQDCDLELEGLT